MSYTRSHRIGLTVVEVLVVMVLIAIVTALTVVAVQHVRASAAQAQSMNNVKNIILGVHQLVDTRGRLPRVPLDQVGIGWTILEPAPPPLTLLLPYIEQSAPSKNHGPRSIPAYLSPADPTGSQALAVSAPVSSYAINAVAFRQALPIETVFRDGASNTIAIAEHYAYGCALNSFHYNDNNMPVHLTRRATFADITDVQPVTEGLPPMTGATRGNLVTFQVAPLITKCNPAIPQTPHTSGMVTAFADGSVHVLSPGISVATFWSLVTPSAGDIPGAW